jgi:hypothetical protein
MPGYSGSFLIKTGMPEPVMPVRPALTFPAFIQTGKQPGISREAVRRSRLSICRKAALEPAFRIYPESGITQNP